MKIYFVSLLMVVGSMMAVPSGKDCKMKIQQKQLSREIKESVKTVKRWSKISLSQYNEIPLAKELLSNNKVDIADPRHEKVEKIRTLKRFRRLLERIEKELFEEVNHLDNGKGDESSPEVELLFKLEL